MRGAVAALGPNEDDASARTQRGLKDLAATADLEFTQVDLVQITLQVSSHTLAKARL